MKPSRLRAIFSTSRCYARFSRTLPSNLAGAPFRATFRTNWINVNTDFSVYTQKAQIRSLLTDVAKNVTQRYSVLQRAQAQDALNAQLAESFKLNGTATRVRLQISNKSQALANLRERAARRRQLKLDDQADQADLFHQEILSDPLRARAWWLNQDSSLITAIGNDYFESTLTQIKEYTDSISDPHRDELLAIFGSFMDWLNSTDKRAAQVLETFNILLAMFQPDDLHTRFNNWKDAKDEPKNADGDQAMDELPALYSSGSIDHTTSEDSIQMK